MKNYLSHQKIITDKIIIDKYNLQNIYNIPYINQITIHLPINNLKYNKIKNLQYLTAIKLIYNNTIKTILSKKNLASFKVRKKNLLGISTIYTKHKLNNLTIFNDEYTQIQNSLQNQSSIQKKNLTIFFSNFQKNSLLEKLNHLITEKINLQINIKINSNCIYKTSTLLNTLQLSSSKTTKNKK